MGNFKPGFFNTPIGSYEDPTLQGELPGPVYRAGGGQTYQTFPGMPPEPRPAADLSRFTNYDPSARGRRAPLDSLETGYKPSAGMLTPFGRGAVDLAQAMWAGVEAPGKAARGDLATYGDAWTTALDYGIAGAPMPKPKGSLGAFSMRSPKDTAKEVIDLLKSGRAADVTDDMLAAADDMYLFNNYDLPMDVKSRMERAKGMGFGDDMYRGDAADMIEFKTGRYAREGIGVTSSSSPKVAASYLTADTPAIYPLRSRANNRLTLDAEGRNWMGVPPDARSNNGAINEVMDVGNYLDEDNLFDFNAGEQSFASTDNISRAAQGAGFDEVAFENVIDRGGSGKWHTGPANDPHTTIMTSDPANIRSKFARFDPRLKHLRNLSAGGAGIAGQWTLKELQAEKQRRGI